MTITAIATFALFSIVPGDAISTTENWAQNYEEAVCSSSGGASQSDLNLVCYNPTVRKLKIEVLDGGLDGRDLAVALRVSNSAEYPILVRTIVADGKNASGEIVDFCSIAVEEALQPGESFEHQARCSFSSEGRAIGDQEIETFSIKASPWD